MDLEPRIPVGKTESDEYGGRVSGHLRTEWASNPRLSRFLDSLFALNNCGDFDSVPEPLWEQLANSMFELEQVVLNSWLMEFSSPSSRQKLVELVSIWNRWGVGVEFFDKGSEMVEYVVSNDVGTVVPTSLYFVWNTLGSTDCFPWLTWLLRVALVLTACCAALLIAVPASMGVGVPLVNIAVAVCLAVVSVPAGAAALLVAHHNSLMNCMWRFQQDRMEASEIRARESAHGQMSLMLPTAVPIDGPPQVGNFSTSPTQPAPPQTMPFSVPAQNVRVDEFFTPTAQQSAGSVAVDGPVTSQTRRVGLASFRGIVPDELHSRFGGNQSVLALQSTIGSRIGAASVSAESEHKYTAAVRALALVDDRDTTWEICSVLWKLRIPITCFTTVSDFVAATAVAEPFRMYLVCADLIVTEDHYAMFRAMEEAKGLVYFSCKKSNSQSIIPAHLVRRLPLTTEIVEDVIRQLRCGLIETLEMFRPNKLNQVPQYTLGRRLGGGSFGNVFEADMEVVGGKCAVKRMYLKRGDSKEKVREIAREVDIMSRLQHPNICQYLFCKRESNCICIFMELCEGGSLASRIHKFDYQADTAKLWLRQILEAVAYLHSKRIIHRDLKPENVLFRSQQVRLTDFGTAAKFRNATDFAKNVKGTFPYMAPEVLLQESYHMPCDIWSFGCVAAEILRVPLPHRTMSLNTLRQFFHELTSDMAIDVEVEDATVKEFLERCLCRDASRRPTPEWLLSHPLLSSDNSSVRRQLDAAQSYCPEVSGRKQSIGVVSLRSSSGNGDVRGRSPREMEFSF